MYCNVNIKQRILYSLQLVEERPVQSVHEYLIYNTFLNTYDRVVLLSQPLNDHIPQGMLIIYVGLRHKSACELLNTYNRLVLMIMSHGVLLLNNNFSFLKIG